MDDNLLNGLVSLDLSPDVTGVASLLLSPRVLDANGRLDEDFLGTIFLDDACFLRHVRPAEYRESLGFGITTHVHGVLYALHQGGRVRPTLRKVGYEHQNDGTLMASLGPNKRRPSLTNSDISLVLDQRLPQ